MACLSGAIGNRAIGRREGALRGLYGHPAEQLLHYARQQKVDLIVMGSLGISGIKEFFLGRVASRVVADAPCSVWVVRPGFRLT